MAIDRGSGPAIARLVQTLVGLVLVDAWVSLGLQVHVLIGARGLSPVRLLVERLRTQPTVGFLDFPSVFWLDTSDATITAGVVVGIVLALLVVVGVAARPLLVVSAALYLGYAVACGVFTSFQWDSMLVEASVLVALLPRDRAAPVAHLLVRLLLFKLYFESGIAKWQSHLGDWRDGSAMAFYYETAPLPTPLAWWAHHLPTWWHAFESRAALVLELVVPWCVFGPRRARLAAFVLLTVFQILNLATANYGFFVWLTLALHPVLLDDGDLARLAVPGRRPVPAAAAPAAGRAIRLAIAAFAGCWAVASVAVALRTFTSAPPFAATLDRIVAFTAPLRLANPYHLFGHITRERLEPQFSVEVGGVWQEVDLRYKPGDPLRPPPFVAPHQPRVDFQLWFYGLGYRGPMPSWVAALLVKLCRDPAAVQPLFATALPSTPEAVRLVIWRYGFTTAEEAGATGAWWHRAEVAASPPIACASVDDDRG